MPAIPRDILNCAIYLYPTAAEAQHGEDAGGSGFLVGYVAHHRGQASLHVYAVTNAHVVNRNIGKSPVIRVNTHSGEFEVLPIAHSEWITHPDGDDVAVCALVLKRDVHKFSWIGMERFLTKEDWHGIGPGSDCFLVGRFHSHDGKQKNMPTLRFGHLAQMPGEPITNTMTGLDQESFLVEIKSISGYSGSPVFAFENRIRFEPMRAGAIVDSSQTQITQQFYLLGVNWCHSGMYERVLQSDKTPIPEEWVVKANTGMAGVVPAWKLRELLESDEVKMSRDAKIKNSHRSSTPVTLDVKQAADQGITFTKQDFEQALRKASRRVQSPSSQSDEEKK